MDAGFSRQLLAAVASGLAGTVLLLTGTTAPANADPMVAIIGPGPSGNYDGVVCIQQMLGVYPDGQFGQQVYDAVKSFQARHQLPADGAVGPATGSALIEVFQRDDCYYSLPTFLP
jgi:peptidoglycan hydrolase-like protein with peptidoglycan-binding domain